jgi:hypothetical protein
MILSMQLYDLTDSQCRQHLGSVKNLSHFYAAIRLKKCQNTWDDADCDAQLNDALKLNQENFGAQSWKIGEIQI